GADGWRFGFKGGPSGDGGARRSPMGPARANHRGRPVAAKILVLPESRVKPAPSVGARTGRYPGRARPRSRLTRAQRLRVKPAWTDPAEGILGHGRRRWVH